jgi:hypothetical protein
MEEAKLPPVPKLMALSHVHNYVRAHHHFEVTRQTPYNWTKRGLAGTKLRFVLKGRNRFTTKGWVDAFLAAVPLEKK